MQKLFRFHEGVQRSLLARVKIYLVVFLGHASVVPKSKVSLKVIT